MIDALAPRAASFYRSLHASFDVVFTEFSDRDAAFKPRANAEATRRVADCTREHEAARDEQHLGPLSRKTTSYLSSTTIRGGPRCHRIAGDQRERDGFAQRV